MPADVEHQEDQQQAPAPAKTAGKAEAGGGAHLALICAIFFLSGAPALLYQLLWQRSLFAIFGINVESVTVIVAAFMLGLGLGSLLGGVISRRPRLPLLLVFGVVELGIGAFGAASLPLFAAVDHLTLALSPLLTFLATFLLVLVPTLLMGATLPILVAYLVERSGNVGRSVGLLYFVNTLGSAVACFAGALLLFMVLGQRGSIFLCVAMNLLVGGGAVLLHLMGKGRAGAGERPVAPGVHEEGAPAGSAAPAVRFPLALLLVTGCGFVSLSYEILWYRVYSFTTGGLAASFALLLGAYLLGIALGSLGARRFCPDRTTPGDPVHLRALAVFLCLANGLGFLVAPAVAFAVSAWGWHFTATLPFVALAAAMLGACFPLVTHLGVAPGPRAGAQVSYLYLGNIVGSTAGSLLTGFVLMDHLSLPAISVLLAVVGLAAGAALFVPARLSPRGKALGFGLAGGGALLALALQGPLFDRFYERLQWKESLAARGPYKHLVETRSGVVSVATFYYEASGEEDEVFGGGIYDGVFSVDLIPDRNIIVRPYSISAWHPAPRRVLMIGLASGSWAQVVAHHPQLEELVVVEINPGYLEVVPRYPSVRSVLENPKVKVVIDDGRRWLKRNPERRFDVIVMNTTFHWRAHATNLLSQEFLELVKGSLAPGGVLLYNTTGSERVQATGARVFPHGFRIHNNLGLSASPIQWDRERWRRVLLEYRIDGRPVLDMTDPAHAEELERLLGTLDWLDPARWEGLAPDVRPPLEDLAHLARRLEGVEPVTEDNMGTEWGKVWE